MEKEESDEKSKKGIPVLVHLRSAGEAPGLKKPKLKIDGLKTVFEVHVPRTIKDLTSSID
jgi:hypothetical protein